MTVTSAPSSQQDRCPMARSKPPRRSSNKRRNGKKQRPRDPGSLPLSICVIARNEEANLPQLLASVAPLEAEVVVVDTGSTDATASIATEAGAKLFRWAWRDDFAAARNTSLGHATRPWILWLDADDRLPAASLDPLRALALQPAERAYSFVVKNTTDEGFSGTEFSQLRMFPNRRDLRFTGAVHEQVLPSLLAAGVPVSSQPLVIHHTGYANEEAIRAKQQRNRAILLEEVQGSRTPIILWYHLATACYSLDEFTEAEAYFRKVLAFDGQEEARRILASIIPYYIASIHLKQGDLATAFTVFQELADPDPATWHPHQVAIAGDLWLKAVSPEAATGWYDRAYAPPQPEGLLPLEPKKTAFAPLRFLADYWRQEGRDGLALDFLRLLKDVLQGTYPPRRAVADTYLRNGMPERAAGLYSWCIDVDGEDPDLWAALVRATAMADDPQAALGFLAAGLAKWPQHPDLVNLAQPAVQPAPWPDPCVHDPDPRQEAERVCVHDPGS